MRDKTSQELKRRVGAYLASSDFDEHFQKIHSFSRSTLLAALPLMHLIGKPEAAKGAWKKLSSGDVHSSRLRRRYARLAENGEVIFTYILVCNASLKRQPGVIAPALVIGNFNGAHDEDALLTLREKLALLSLGKCNEPRDQEVAKLLNDLDYRFQRRRYLPTDYTGGVQVIAFDLMLIGSFLPTETLQIEVIPCIAEPGKRGLIAMIPYFLITDVLRG